jgi:uncharacterized protein YndB with AHSA1/START domain
MSTHVDDAAEVRTSIEVAVPPERAFRVFTADFDRWWPRSHHILPGELRTAGVEPFVGGRMWEENDAGRSCAWGRVLTWEPPHVFAFSWLLGPEFEVPDPDAAGSRVTVTFTAVDVGTRVDLVHDRLEVHGERWRELRTSVASEGGWPQVLAAYAGVSR